jgi:UMF1 family MFS transporter
VSGAVRRDGRATLLGRLGLDRPELRAWVLYDVANSAAVTSVLTAILPIYFARVAAAELPPAVATQRFALATTVGLAVVAVLAPVLGTLADVRPMKKRMLAAFALGGASATAALFAVGPGDWLLASALLVLLNVGLNGSFVFYDALLPHVAREHELHRVSSAGFAAGYLAGGVLLAAQLAWIARPGLLGLPAGGTPAQVTLPTRLAFLSVAVWWVAFTIPLLLRVREPEIHAPPGAAREGTLARLARTVRQLRHHRQATLLLVAFLVYNDGIGTIIRMAAIYGSELGLSRGALIGAILLVQMIGVPCAYLFAALAGRLGAKRAILGGLAVYTGIAVLGYFTRTAAHFFALAVLVGLVQGGTQALSRSLFASMVPRHLSGEFFGFFAVSDKFAGIVGPAVFAAAIGVTGSSRVAVLSVIAFFVIGAVLLLSVDVEQGRREARAAEARVEAAGASGAGMPVEPEDGAA